LINTSYRGRRRRKTEGGRDTGCGGIVNFSPLLSRMPLFQVGVFIEKDRMSPIWHQGHKNSCCGGRTCEGQGLESGSGQSKVVVIRPKSSSALSARVPFYESRPSRSASFFITVIIILNHKCLSWPQLNYCAPPSFLSICIYFSASVYAV